MKMRIGTKLMLAAALGVLAVVFAVSFAAYRIARGGLEEEITSHLVSAAESRAAHVRTFLHEHKEMIRMAATSRVLRMGLRSLETGAADRAAIVQDMNTRLLDFIQPVEDICTLLLLDRDGEVVASTTPEHIGSDRSTDAYFVGAREGPFVKDANVCKTMGCPSLTVSAPILDDQGGPLGTLVVQLEMDELNAITSDRTGLGETGETYLINKYGFMITSSRFSEDTFLKQKVDTQNARECLADGVAMRRGVLAEGHECSAKVYVDYRGVRVLGVHAHVREMGWGLLAEMDASEAFAPLARLRSAIVAFAVLSTVAALAGAYLFARRISQPIHELHTGSERIGNGELDFRVQVNTRDEIGQLADEFNRMAAKLSESYASLEQRVAERTADLAQANEELEDEIAEHKRDERALRASEGKYRTLVENLPQRIFLKDTNSVYVSCNRNYAADLGIRPEDIAGKVDYDFYAEGLAEKYRADDKRVMDSGEAVDIEEPYVHEGQQMVVHTVKTPVRDQQGHITGLLAIFWDITARKQAEEQLQRNAQRLESLNAEFERSNRDLQEFTYAVSHDLQEPLRKMNTFAEFLVEDCAECLPEDSLRHLRTIREASLRMKDRIQHLLALARVGTQGGQMAPVEPRPVINEVLEDLSERVRECGADISVQEDLPRVSADRVQLAQVFQNLIGNALKFRSPDRPPRVTISARERNGEAVFSVADNGIGIEERFSERIFGVFRRLHQAEEYEGDGVGLALCKRIIQRHGGRISLQSEPGIGSTFTFTLPIAS